MEQMITLWAISGSTNVLGVYALDAVRKDSRPMWHWVSLFLIGPFSISAWAVESIVEEYQNND